MAEPSCICPTSGSKGGSEVDAVPSETEMIITGRVFAADSGDVFVLEADSPPPLQAQSVSAPEQHAIVSHCTCGRDLGI